MSGFWTEEKVETLKRLLEEGKSFGQCASILGAGRNMIMGKCHRLGLKSKVPSGVRGQRHVAEKPDKAPSSKKTRPSPSAKAAHGEQRQRAEAVSKAAYPEPSAIEAVRAVDTETTPPKGILIQNITDLRENLCRWIAGDPRSPDARYCGEPTKIGRSFCEEHHARAFTRYVPKGQSNA